MGFQSLWLLLWMTRRSCIIPIQVTGSRKIPLTGCLRLWALLLRPWRQTPEKMGNPQISHPIVLSVKPANPLLINHLLYWFHPVVKTLDRKLPTANRQPPTVNHQPPTFSRQPPTRLRQSPLSKTPDDPLFSRALKNYGK